MSEKKTAEQRILDAQKRRADKRALNEGGEAEQFAKDLEALEALEDEYGVGAIRAVKTPRFVEGQPTRAFMRRPEGIEFKRYTDQINKAVLEKKPLRPANELLAQACWVYPKTQEAREQMLEIFGGFLISLGHAAAELAQGQADEEGKD